MKPDSTPDQKIMPAGEVDSGGCAPMPGYASLWGRVLRKWDWWVYRKACVSLRRMTFDNPGMSYLMELNIRGWNEQLKISPQLRRSTELFHEAMRDHSEHNAIEHPTAGAAGRTQTKDTNQK